MPRRAEQSKYLLGATWLHVTSLTRVSGSVCYVKCRGERGIRNRLLLLPGSPPCRPENTPHDGHEATGPKVETCLKMALFAEVCPNPAPWLRRKRDCGNFLAQFLLG